MDAAPSTEAIVEGRFQGVSHFPFFALHLCHPTQLHSLMVEVPASLSCSHTSYLHYYIYYLSRVYRLVGGQLIYTGLRWGGSTPCVSQPPLLPGTRRLTPAFHSNGRLGGEYALLGMCFFKPLLTFHCPQRVTWTNSESRVGKNKWPFDGRNNKATWQRA